MIFNLIKILLLFLNNGVLCYDIIPTELVNGALPGERAYTLHLFVGTPPESLQFEITFKTDLFILYRQQRLHSVSYSEENGGSDIIFFGSKSYRVPIVFDPQRHLYGEHSHCIHCIGMIGFGKGSLFWQIWTDCSFTSISMIAGGLHDLMYSTGQKKCKGCIISCDVYSLDSSMCVTQGILENYRIKNDENMHKIRISIDNPFTYLPQKLYDRYMLGKNMFKDDPINDWEPLKISVPQMKIIELHLHSNLVQKGINVDSCEKSIRMIIDPSTLIYNFKVEGKTLLLKSNPDPNDTSITLGNSIWKQFIFYKTVNGEALFIQQHILHDHFSILSGIIFALLLWYLVRWKMTDMILTNIKDKNTFQVGNWLNAFYEFTAPILSLIAILLPNNRDILSDFPVLYSISIVIYSVALILELFVTALWTINWLKLKPYKREILTQNVYSIFRINFLRNITHETILMIGLWVIVVERRTEGISTALTVIINIYNLYNITFHVFLFLIYTIYSGWDGIIQNTNKKYNQTTPSVFWILIILTLPLLFGFQFFASYVYFTAPLLMRNSQIYKELILPSLVLFYIMIIILALEMVSIYMKKSLKIILTNSPSTQNKSKSSIVSLG